MLNRRLSSIIFFLASFAICAQDTPENTDLFDLSLSDLQNLKVTSASRTQKQSYFQAPATVIVVTRQMIEERGYNSLLDCMEDLPGFKVDRGVDPRWMNDVTLRGVRYMDKFIILLNGVRISSPTNEIIPIMENYPVHLAAQIEFIYGPASSLYGADAFSGVINIITEQATEELQISGYTEGGQYNSILSNLGLSKRFDNGLSVIAGGQIFYDKQPDLAKFYPEEFENRDRELTSGIFNTEAGIIEPVEPVNPQAEFPQTAYGYFMGLSYGDLSLNYFGNRSRVPSSTANTPSNSVYNRNQYFAHNLHMVGAQFRKEINSWILRTQLTYSAYNLDNQSNFRNVFTDMSTAYLYAKGSMFKIEQLFNYNFGPDKQFNLSGGGTFDIFHSIPRSNDTEEPVIAGNIDAAIVAGSVSAFDPDGIPAELIERDYRNVGGFLQLDYNVATNLKLTAGSRIDKDTRFEANINPRFGLNYEVSDQFKIKAHYGTAFLAPSPQSTYDRYGTVDVNNQGEYFADFYNLPNPSLEPQKINMTELNLYYQPTPGLSFNLSTYYSRISNLISPLSSEKDSILIASLYPNFSYTLAGRQFFIDSIQINANLGEVENYGGMLVVAYRRKFTDQFQLKSEFSYSYVDGMIDIDEEGPAVERNLPGVSPHQIRLGLTAYTGRFIFHTMINWLSSQRAFNVKAIKDQNNNGILTDDQEYFEINGYTLIDARISYQLSRSFSASITLENLLDQRYRNINIGARPEDISAGSATVEFSRGAPQNPVRAFIGLRYQF